MGSDLRLNHSKVFANWVVWGFAMGIVEGTVMFGDRVWEAYGLGEIFK